MSRLALCGALVLVALAGCGKPPPPAAPAAAKAAAVTPSDPKLARLYEQTCKACHTNPATGAPQAGDRAAWEPRLAQGMDRVLDHVINGYKGMPPLGSCQDCSEAEFKALIDFMAGQ
jgi:cytochrome c5